MSSKQLAKASNKLISGGSNKKVLFSGIIEQFTGHKIKPLPVYTKYLIKELSTICEKTIVYANEDMDFTNSSNKIGSLFEKYFEKACNESSRWSAESPLTLQGKNMASGYPDLIVRRRRKHVSFLSNEMYLEIKTMGVGSVNATAPSFSWQNSINAKISKSLPHMLVSFIRDGEKGFIDYKIVNLEDLYVDIEVKAISNNKLVYSHHNVLK